MQWMEKITQTRVRRQLPDGHASALRAMAMVQISMQLFLWITFGGYDRAVQTIWQSALVLIAPTAVLWLVWHKAADGLATRAGQLLPLALLPCLLGDATLILYALCGYIDLLIPEYPYAAGAIATAAVCWAAVWMARENGVAYGITAIKYALLLFFLLGTVLLNSSKRADRLWPLMGQGVENMLYTALLGTGSVWGAALMAVLPRKSSGGKAWTFLPWGLGVVWALWHGFLRPWLPGDALSAGERLTGLARHASGVVSYELAGLMWLAGGPAALCASALSGEIILRRAFRKGPRPVLCACVLLPALVLVLAWPERLPRWFGLLLPWRGAVSLITGGLILLLGRKRR